MSSTVSSGTIVDVWGDVVGQPRAVAQLQAAVASPVHAYLLVGPRGSGKRALARAFAAELLADGRPDPERHRRLALAEEHPDLVVVERVGASISAEQADRIIDRASRTPVEGDRKVLVLDEFHLVTPAVGPKLLKTIEEPPEGTFFVVLAEEITADLVTIASRCVRVDLGPVPTGEIVARLVGEGVDEARAEEAAALSGGDLRRARVLAADDRLALRRQAWHEVPDRLDGTGATATRLVDDLLAMIDDSLVPLRARHATEVEELEERVSRSGERGSGRRELAERHKREERRHRVDELRFGLLTLARRYRDQLLASARPQPAVAALDAVQQVAQALVRNPNERLQLQALFVKLGDRSST
ncbi:AAA family ATPase [Rhabdothermincola sediminis]|uniref:AAA family ATPase n=1 Tax=Rhabdothermincola sediminis TaxID=2751370 RepID=UPI001AA03996|nr:AAA family ATPase [Rhabdothermincola sediminis]